MENDWKKRLGVVYSTDPGFEYDEEGEKGEKTPDPGQQNLYVKLDRKRRRGKTVTLVEGFRGGDEDLRSLASELKSACGVGGSAKNGEILVQGDFRDRVVKMLTEKGYRVKKSGG